MANPNSGNVRLTGVDVFDNASPPNRISPATKENQTNILAAILPSDMEGGGKVSVGTTAVKVTFIGTTSSIIISADIDNTGTLYIGKSNVDSSGNNAITFLEAGENIAINYDDSNNDMYVVGSAVSQNFWKGALL